ncbi:MAG TPA: hypothetical protein DDX51_07005 [Clostridiales bacterium]|nr:hypothetical protein [Clostridiales bacterium]
MISIERGVSMMFEQQIAEYLTPHCSDTELVHEMAVRTQKKVTRRPNAPDPTVAAAALHLCAWVDDTAREHYAGLLACAMDARRREFIHPAFLPMIGQMDSLDWEFLSRLAACVTMPVVDCYLCKTKREGGFLGRQVEIKSSAIKILSRMTDFLPDDGDYARVQAAMDNLLRLQIIEVHMRSGREGLADIRSDNAYEEIYLRYEHVIGQAVGEFRGRFPKYHGGQLRFRTGNLMLTPFGGRFTRVCLP